MTPLSTNHCCGASAATPQCARRLTRRDKHTQHDGGGGGKDPTHRKFYNETDVIKPMESMSGKRIVLTIDPNELKEGVCKIYPSKDEKFAVCLEDEKIKIFPIEE
ncbi:MAG: hypothetical protein U9N07_05815 [Euryarchaeota archaeon]|nr:hypothetical protein [Euryarchaeota archaeon]